MVRTLSGAVLAVVVLGAVIWSQWSFGALLLAMLVAGMLEFYGLAEKQGNAPQKIVGMAAGIVLFALNFAFVSDAIEILSGASQAFACGMAFMLLLIPAMFICELYRKQQNPASGIGTTLMGVCYIALPLSLMCYIPIIGSEVWTPWVMIFYIFIIWANDVFAYLVGMSVGRHRMFERLSPKKSWEGFFGGLAGAVAMGYVAARVLDADVWAWLGLALVAAATSLHFERFKLQASVLGTFVNENVASDTTSAGNKMEDTPTVITSYKPFKNIDLSLRAFYKRIFRMPTLNDFYYTYIWNIKLKPE